MLRRPFLLLTLLSGLTLPALMAQEPALAAPAGCVPAITEAEHNRLSPQEQRKYRRIEAGANRGRYKLRYYELVGGSGDCAGFYSNPCGHDRFSTERVDSTSCSQLQAIAKSKKLKPVKAIPAEQQVTRSAKNRKKLERIPDGPDAGKYKPKYYERTTEGMWGNPCGHDGRSTETFDSNSCSEIQAIVRLAQ